MTNGRWGLTVPLTGAPLREHESLIRALPDWGYTDLWSAETNRFDAFTPLALAAVWEPTLRLGTAIVPVFTRGPAVTAMSAAALAEAAPGRFVLGLGSSSPVIVEQWNGIPFTDPYRRTREVLRLVRDALAGQRASGPVGPGAVTRFKLERAPEPAPPIMLAALRPQMLRLAGAEADGAILNWLAPTDVPQCLEAIGTPTETVARIFVCPTADTGYARALGRALIASYLTVPAYAAFHDWLGRGDALRAMQRAWAAGDRAGAAAAVPDDVVDALLVHGAPERCRDRVAAYADAGVGTPVIALLPTPDATTPLAVADVVRRMGPAA